MNRDRLLNNQPTATKAETNPYAPPAGKVSEGTIWFDLYRRFVDIQIIDTREFFASRENCFWFAGVCAPGVCMFLAIVFDYYFPWQFGKEPYVFLILVGWVGPYIALKTIFRMQVTIPMKILRGLGTMFLSSVLWVGAHVLAVVTNFILLY